MNEVRTNTKAVVSLTLGILSIVIPFIGLVLGIIGVVISRMGLKEIESSNENGRGLAISGFICSLVGIVIYVFWIFLAIFSYYSFTNVEFNLEFISLLK
ncbi:DUF4190 domain-containing protein [Bacillus sp. FJAT-49736]|uniref:DUF4190 domain-containing protein n=1 Tax=Bacillus sp. FJAT-49736 TaxID=2833582 RepID=UPI001BC972FF|nr:DUF4190 domain-containing protein [Bacillus sp. FJAT-49736]MBS4171682.1 DUF4190 domain-containing protein [Bacillus sp. FJAT-49736]